MPAPDDPPDGDPPDEAATFRLLHEVRLRGVVDLEETETVAVLLDGGLVVRSARGIRITTEGRLTHATWARLPRGDEYEQVAQRAYARFLPLNREVLRICSDWQVRPGGIPNDHRDAHYDWSVLDRMHELNDRIAPVVARLGRTVERFAEYRPRLRAALERVDAGETEWLTSPRLASYHTVWMQMHEDLLLALGADRSSEPDPESEAVD